MSDRPRWAAPSVFAALPPGVAFTDADVVDDDAVDLSLAADRLAGLLGADPRVTRLRELAVS